MLSAASGVEGGSLVIGAGGNGAAAGIQVAGLPGRWFTAPAAPPRHETPDGVPEGRALGAIGDSAIVDAMGFGAMAMNLAPEQKKGMGHLMPEGGLELPALLLAAEHPGFDGLGLRVGMTARAVVDTERRPVVSLGVLDNEGELGRLAGGRLRDSAERLPRRRGGPGGGMTAELNELGAREVAGLVASGKAGVEEVVAACIARIEAREPDVGAFEWFDADHALEQARALDNGPVKGVLHGVPLGVKDIIDTRDMPTRNGSPIHADRRPSSDASCVALIARGWRRRPGQDGDHGVRLFLSGKDEEPAQPGPHHGRVVHGVGGGAWPTACSRSGSARRPPPR